MLNINKDIENKIIRYAMIDQW